MEGGNILSSKVALATQETLDLDRVQDMFRQARWLLPLHAEMNLKSLNLLAHQRQRVYILTLSPGGTFFSVLQKLTKRSTRRNRENAQEQTVWNMINMT